MRGDHIGKNLIDFFFSISGYFATITCLFSTKYQENTQKYTFRILHLHIHVRHFCYQLISTQGERKCLGKKKLNHTANKLNVLHFNVLLAEVKGWISQNWGKTKPFMSESMSVWSFSVKCDNK